MTRPLQTMTQYTVITKDITTIDGNNKLEAILVYAYIKSRENYATHSLDNLTYEEIHYKLLSINKTTQTVKNIVPSLYVNNTLFKGYSHNTKLEEDDDEIKTRILYYFHESCSNFFYINNDLFKMDSYSKIPTQYVNQVRGLLLLIKAHCLNGTNCYFFQRKSKSGINYAELSRVLNMDRDTIEKYMILALDGGLIKKIPNGLAIMDRNIYPYYFKKNLYDDIYKDLFNWCLKKNIYPPSREDSYLSILWAHYPIISKGIIELAKMNDTETNRYFKMMRENIEKFPFIQNYLLYELTIKKVKPKDDYLTWNYLFKALNLKLPTKPQPQYFTM